LPIFREHFQNSGLFTSAEYTLPAPASQRADAPPAKNKSEFPTSPESGDRPDVIFDA
jgi:hypothetical protein